MRRNLKFILSVIFLSASVLFAEDVSSLKNININGLEIFNENVLKNAITPPNALLGKFSFHEISDMITRFYFQKGYSLIAVYLIENTKDHIDIYVDEGHLGQIVFLGLDDITLIRIKSSFDLPHRIYHRETISKEMARLRKKFGFKDLVFNIIPAPDYNSRFIQIDNILKLPLFSAAQNLPFYERYGYRYNMEIRPSSYTRQEAEQNLKGFSYNIKLFYLGVKPTVDYTRPNLFFNNDKTKIILSGGVNYLGNFNPAQSPSLGFLEGNFIYNLPHSRDGFFVPRTNLDLYYAHGTRPDIGITSYDYLKTLFIIEPGFSPLSSFKIYPGIGVEKVYFFNARLDPTRTTENIHDDQILWFLFSTKVDIEHFLGMLYPSLKHRATISYTYFFQKKFFNQWDLFSHADFSVFHYDILSLDLSGIYLTGAVPFYYDDSVNGGAFLGFTRQSYHTRAGIKMGSEYRTSIYRGYLFAGPYLGITFFKALGLDLKGNQTGFCGGLSVHYIFFDQFEFSVYFGRDYLVSTRKSDINLAFSLEKKF